LEESRKSEQKDQHDEAQAAADEAAERATLRGAVMKSKLTEERGCESRLGLVGGTVHMSTSARTGERAGRGRGRLVMTTTGVVRFPHSH